MSNELDAILKKKLEAENEAQKEAATKEQERQEREAKLSARLPVAFGIIEEELSAAADVLKRHGYKDVSVINPPPTNKWQGLELRVKLDADPRTPGLRYSVFQGHIYAHTKITEMGDLVEHDSHGFAFTIRNVHVDPLQPDEGIRELVQVHIKKFVEAVPAPTGVLGRR